MRSPKVGSLSIPVHIQSVDSNRMASPSILRGGGSLGDAAGTSSEVEASDNETTPQPTHPSSPFCPTLEQGLSHPPECAVVQPANSAFSIKTAGMSTHYEELFRADRFDDIPCYLPEGAASRAASDGNISDVCNIQEPDGEVQLNGDILEPQSEDQASRRIVLQKDSNRHNPNPDKRKPKSDICEPVADMPASSSSSHGGTSGYMAEGGSRSASISTTSSRVEDVTDELAGQASESTSWSDWLPGKRHQDEDDTYESWRQHRKHFFILSNAGKPIFTRYGDEHKLAGFSATLQAIMSFVENSHCAKSVEAFVSTALFERGCSGDVIHSIRAGDHQIVFAVKGPLYLVSISATEEPMQALKGQLELLHGQLLLILTKAVEKCFSRNAKFDMRPLLGGTEVVFSSLIHAFSWNPGTFLHAYTCLHLPYATRQAVGVALHEIAESGVLFALLMSGTKVISIGGPRKAALHPDDVYLLSNFVSSSESFRTTESFSPICLPRYNATAFLYAYVQYVEADVYLVLLTADSEAFFFLKECRTRIEVVLQDLDIFRDIKLSLLHGGLRVEELPTSGQVQEMQKFTSRVVGSIQGPSEGSDTGLYHFLYRSNYLDQFVSSEYSQLLDSEADQKRLFRAYQKLHASMHDTVRGTLHKMQYRRDEKFVLLSWRTTDFELFAAFDPSMEKGSAIAVCNRVCQWLCHMESDIFLLGTTPFNWANDGYNCWEATLAILWPFLETP